MSADGNGLFIGNITYAIWFTVTATKATECPNCGYKPTGHDDPFYTAHNGKGECPRCGVVIEKVFSRARKTTALDGEVDLQKLLFVENKKPVAKNFILQRIGSFGVIRFLSIAATLVTVAILLYPPFVADYERIGRFPLGHSFLLSPPQTYAYVDHVKVCTWVAVLWIVIVCLPWLLTLNSRK